MTTVITDEWKFAMRGIWKIKSSLDAKKPCSCVINLSVPTCTYYDTAGFCQALCNLLPSLCQWLCGTTRQWVCKEHKTHFILTLRIKFYLYRYAQTCFWEGLDLALHLNGAMAAITGAPSRGRWRAIWNSDSCARTAPRWALACNGHLPRPFLLQPCPPLGWRYQCWDAGEHTLRGNETSSDLTLRDSAPTT